MYARQPSENRYSRNMNIPSNYSGNAFRQDTPTEEIEAPEEVGEIDAPQNIQPLPSDETLPAYKAESSDTAAGIGRLLGRGGGGIGLEELLIIGIVILLSQGEVKDDLAFLLLLLLFIQ